MPAASSLCDVAFTDASQLADNVSKYVLYPPNRLLLAFKIDCIRLYFVVIDVSRCEGDA
jgi:hypothetical protein